jgi:crotonobetainyl-CoA:carnitine CoA-transferase CaiB-like acyl-CoA transferase
MLDKVKLSPAAQSHPAPSTGLPLSGFRVVELTTAWAGPMAGRILAFLGAEVVHIEPANNLDSWRSHTALLLPKRYPDQEAGERRYNRASLFNSQNTDKISLSLDLKAPGGKDALRDLIAKADGLITNFTPGMLQRLGFGNDVLWSIKPDLCIVEMPAYGNSGVMQSWTALGPTMEQVAGMCAMVGYGDGRPVSTGPAYLDPIGAFHGSAAMLTALLHRVRTGEGQHVEVPQVEAAMQLIGEHLLHAVETGMNPLVNGNRLADAAPHDVFPARGEDEWLAIDVTTDEEWRVLCRVIGTEAMAGDPRFATAAERVKHQDELAVTIAAWSRPRDKHESAKLLQDAGVPAAAVYKASDTLACDYLNARKFSIPLDHPEAGRHLHQGLPYRFEKTPVKHRRAAPCLGEHNHYILKNVLGRSDAEVAELERSGAIRSVPDS